MATVRMLVVQYLGWTPRSIDLTGGFEPGLLPEAYPAMPCASSALEHVVRTITSEITPRVEVSRPGTCSFEVRGPVRYFGGEEGLRRKVEEVLHDASTTNPSIASIGIAGIGRAGIGRAGIGIADGRFAATLAALQDLTVPPGQSRSFLAPLPLSLLRASPLTWHPAATSSHVANDDAQSYPASDHVKSRARRSQRSRNTAASFDFLEILDLLGIRTFGELAEISEQAVLERFGKTAWRVHRLARGLDDRPLEATDPPREMATVTSIDPPAERADIAAFAARPIASELAQQLAAKGVVCTRLRIEIETDHAERLVRSWRSGDALDAEMMVERVLWQIGGWLAGSVKEPRPTGGIATIRLAADEVLAAGELQMELWGAASFHESRRGSSDRRAIRCADRLCGMLGPGGVLTAQLRGGRSPTDRILLVPWGFPTSPASASPGSSAPASSSGPLLSRAQPWPGRHPLPAPAVVHPQPIRAEVFARNGAPVSVSGRGELSAPPALASFGGCQCISVAAWAGPWLADERWWDPLKRRRRAWFQLLTEDPAGSAAVAGSGSDAGSGSGSDAGSGSTTAHLCFVERGRWWLEATYD